MAYISQAQARPNIKGCGWLPSHDMVVIADECYETGSVSMAVVKIDGTSIPSALDSYNYLEDKSRYWNKIGRKLGLKENFRNNIAADYSLDNDARLERVLVKWIETSSSEVTWNHLYRVIKGNLSFTDVAKKMEKEIKLDWQGTETKHSSEQTSLCCCLKKLLIVYYKKRRYLIPILFFFSFATTLYFLRILRTGPALLYDDSFGIRPDHTSDSMRFNYVPTTDNLTSRIATLHNYNIPQQTQECSTAMQFTKYANSHAEIYKNIKHIDDVLTIGYMKQYISVVIVKKNSKFNKKEANQFAEEMVHSPDKIHRETLNIIDLFKPFHQASAVNKERITFVLVSGAPGIGKSTLAMEIARNWQTLTDFSLAFLIKLREKKFQHLADFSDIENLYNSLNIPEDIRKCIIETNGKGILWILDGFDELPLEAQTSHSSFYHQMIQKQFHDISQSSTIVTSRPSATTNLSPYLDDETTKHVELVGFNKIQIKEFAMQQFKKRTNLLPSFTDYYTQNPLIEALMYVPLNAAIITLVFQKEVEDGRPPPHSLTELYNSLVCTLLQRQMLKLNQKNSISSPDCKLMTAEDIDQLPSDVKNKFLSLAKLAYHGTLRQNYVFSEVEDDLGLMSKVASLYGPVNNPVYSYNFFHTTLQEYLAAIHVAQNSSLVNCMKHHEVVVMFIFGIFSRAKDPDKIIALSQIFDQQKCPLRYLYEYPDFKHVEHPYQVFPFDELSCGLPSDYYIAGYLLANFNVSIQCISVAGSFNVIGLQRNIGNNFISGLDSNLHHAEERFSSLGKGSIQELSIIYSCDLFVDYVNATQMLYDHSSRFLKQTLNLFFITDLLCPLRITSSKEIVSFTCGNFKHVLNQKQQGWFKKLKIFVNIARYPHQTANFTFKGSKENFLLEGEFDYLHITTQPSGRFPGLRRSIYRSLISDVLSEIFKSYNMLKINTLSLQNFDFHNLSSHLHYLINANHETVSNQLILHHCQFADLDIFLKNFVLKNHHKLEGLRITPIRRPTEVCNEEMICNLLQNSTVTHLTMFLYNSSNFNNLLSTKKLSSLRIWWFWSLKSSNYKFFRIISSNSFIVNQLDIILDTSHINISKDGIKALNYMIMNYTGKSPLALHLINDSFPISGVIALINATLLNTSHRASISVSYSLYSRLPHRYLKYTKQSDVVNLNDYRCLPTNFFTYHQVSGNSLMHVCGHMLGRESYSFH